MKRICKKRALSLIELILSIALLSVVILTGLSMELGVRRILSSTDVEAAVMGEAVFLMTWVTRDINQGIGTVFSPVYSTASSGNDKNYSIRIDRNRTAPFAANGLADANDRWVVYRFRGDLVPPQLWYYADAGSGSYKILSNTCTVFLIDPPDSNGISAVTIGVRRDAAQPGNATNPEITLRTSVHYRELSLK